MRNLLRSTLIACTAMALTIWIASGSSAAQESEHYRTNEALKKVVRSGLASVMACYQNQLKSKADLAGKISVEMVIQQDGGVKSVVITENTTKSDELARCVTDTMESWRFEAIEEDGEDNIELTLPFSPGE